MQIEIWSDVVCPWCYIGKRRLESALADFEHADEAERRLVERHEGIRYVFLDPTAGDGRARAQAHEPES